MRLQLIALFTFALAAPRVAAAQPGEPWELGLDTLLYTDDDNVLVLTPQAGVRYRFDEDGSEISAAGSVDIVSAASVDVVSHATNRFSETREEAILAGSFAIGDFVPSLSYRGSFEPDYVSNGGRVGTTARLGTADSVLGVAYGLTYDLVGMTGTPAEVFRETLVTHAAELSLTQVLGPNTILRGVYALTVQDGYLEKPYRFVALFTEDALARAAADGVTLGLDTFDRYRLPERPPESVPDLRVRHAVGVRFLQWVDGISSALSLDYQLYFDDWGVIANAIEPAIETHLSDDLRLRLGVRFYHQTSADFWQRTYVVSQPGRAPEWRSADRDLSEYVTGSFGARLEWHVGAVALYVDGTGAYTSYADFLFRDHLFTIVALAGLRVHL
jgi:hypothetical protein